MTRGFLNHIWYKLLDEEGVPIPNAAILLSDLNGDDLITFDSTGVSAVSLPLYTDSEGIFEFYVKDDIGVPSGAPSATGHYPWNEEFQITWLKDDKSGLITGDDLFGDFAQVNENDTNSRVNKAMSNWLGYEIEDHINFMFGTTNRCGSSSSSSSSVSSSSSSLSSSSSESNSESSSSFSSSSESSCTPQFFETIFPATYTVNTGIMTESEGNYVIDSVGNVIDIDVDDLTGYDTQPQRIKFTCYLVGTSSFTSFIIRNSNNDIIYSSAYDTGQADGVVSFTFEDLDWLGFDAGSFYFASTGAISFYDIQFWTDCGISYSSSSTSST